MLDYFNILFILDLNSEFRNLKLWDQKLLFKGFVSLIQEGQLSVSGRRMCTILDL